MGELAELDAKLHQNFRHGGGLQREFFAAQHVIHLRAVEIGQFAACLPVFLNRSQQSGLWSISAMTALVPGHNLFVGESGWLGCPEPSIAATFPYFLKGDPASLAFDNEFTELLTGEGARLFSDTGEPTFSHETLLQQLRRDRQDDATTRLFLNALNQHSLIKPIDMQVQFSDGDPQTITGLHTIDEDRLQSLETEALQQLHMSNFLLPVHAMLISLYQLNGLVNRHNSTELPSIAKVKMEVAKAIQAS